MAGGCDAFGPDLGPFLDGELDGTRMLRVSRHLETCPECASTLEDIGTVGRTLRDYAPADPPRAVFDGLAGAVVSRARAESAMSWRATFSRGFDDWHWALVGGGAIAATFVSTSLLSVMLAFGPTPREDSLSAMTTSLASPAGFFFVYASPTGGPDEDVVMVQVANGRPAAPPLVSELVVSREHLQATGGWARAIVTNSGCANAATGEAGRQVARQMAAAAAAAVGCADREVLVASTGVIGVLLDIEKVRAGITAAAAALSATGRGDFLLDLRTARTAPRVSSWLARDRTIRANFTTEMRMAPASAFDAVVVFDRLSPVVRIAATP